METLAESTVPLPMTYPSKESDEMWNSHFSALTLQEALENPLEMVNVFILGSGEDQDVIEVDKNKLVNHVSEYVVNKGLEDGRSIGEAKRHHQVLVVASGGVERCLPSVSLSNPDQVIGIA